MPPPIPIPHRRRNSVNIWVLPTGIHPKAVSTELSPGQFSVGSLPGGGVFPARALDGIMIDENVSNKNIATANECLNFMVYCNFYIWEIYTFIVT